MTASTFPGAIPMLLFRGPVITDANPSMERLLEWEPGSLVGQDYAAVLPADERERLEARHRRRQAGGDEPTVYETVVLSRSGRRIPVEAHVALGAEGTCIQVIDRSDRILHQERLAGLARLGARVQEGQSRAEVLRLASLGLVDLGLAAAMLRREGGDAVVEAFHVPGPVATALRAAGLDGEPVGRRLRLLGGDWRDGALFIDDAPRGLEQRLPGAGARLADLGRQAGLARAVVLEVGDFLGTLLVAVGSWIEPADVPAFRLFAAQVAAALASARAFTEVWARNELVEITATATSLPEFFARGGAVVQQALDCDAVAVWLHDVPTGDLILGHFRGDTPEILRGLERVPFRTSPYFGPLLEKGRPGMMRVEELPEPERSAFERAGFTVAASAPLRSRSHVVGLLSVGLRRPGASARALMAQLRALAGPFAAAVEGQRLLDDLRHRVSELELLNATAVASASMDLRELLADALSRMVQTFGADGGSGYLLEGGHLARQVFVGTRATGEPEPAARLPSDRGASGEALRTLVPVPLSRGEGEDPRPPEPAPGRSPHGVAIPLVVRNRALGVFLLERREAGAFQPGELRLLAAVAAQVGVAVENARLFEDLTRSYVDLGRAQKKLVHRERLAALGELSAVVAHEVRNPLAVIFNSLGSLQRILHPHGDAKLLLDVIQEEADRLNRTVGDLLDFARPAEPTVRLESLERVVEDSVNAALAHDPPEVVVQRDYDPGLGPVPLDARQVRQAVLNLAVNALQSMPRGGRLTVRTRAEGGGARVEVADTGGGVPAAIRPKVFEPFFTTKPTGTGLGLAVVRRIAEGHGGSVELCEEPGGGACFVLHFPGPLPDPSPEVLPP